MKNWLSRPQEAVAELYATGRRFQTATLDPRGIAELNAALDLILQTGVDKIETHNLALAKRLWEGLSALGLKLHTPQNIQTSIVTCAVPPDGHVGAALAERGCVVTDRQGHLRFSPHLFNTADEVDQALDLLEQQTEPACGIIQPDPKGDATVAFVPSGFGDGTGPVFELVSRGKGRVVGIELEFVAPGTIYE